jgi:hypothetical protein
LPISLLKTLSVKKLNPSILDCFTSLSFYKGGKMSNYKGIYSLYSIAKHKDEDFLSKI